MFEIIIAISIHVISSNFAIIYFLYRLHSTTVYVMVVASCGQLATYGEANGSLDLARGSNRCFMQKSSKKD